MKPPVIIDLKTERTDVGQPLPAALRLLPVAFIASILGAIGISGYAMVQIKNAEAAEATAKAAETAQRMEITRIATESTGVEKEVANATEVKDWVATTNQLQPMLLAINRAMTNDNTISQLSLSRREEMSAQIIMSLQLSSAKGQAQIDLIRTSLSQGLGMRSFSETMSTRGAKNEMNFDCTWIQTDQISEAK